MAADRDASTSSSRLEFVWNYLFETQASSRSSALIRIGLALILWVRYGRVLLLFRDLTPLSVGRGVAFFVLTTLMLVGLRSRLSSALTAALLWLFYYYWGQHLGREGWTHHHTYLLAIGVTLVALTPCDKSYSIDRWLAIRRAERTGQDPPEERGNVWGLRLIVLQLSAIYLFAAWDKSTWAFLSGERMESYLAWYYLGFEYPTRTWLPALCMIISVGTVALEYALAVGLPFEHSRRWLVIPGLLLHAAFYVFLPVSTYSVTVFVLYLAYFDPDAVHRVIDRLHGQ